MKPFLAELETKSKARVAASKDFAYLLEDIEQVKTRKEEKAVSLNEAKRLAERDEDKARSDARKKERNARTKSGAQIWELDLDMVEADKPLVVFTGEKAKEDAELAQAAPAVNPDGTAAIEDEEDAEADPLVDPHLDETIAIVRDYSGALAQKNGKPAVASKKD